MSIKPTQWHLRLLSFSVRQAKDSTYIKDGMNLGEREYNRLYFPMLKRQVDDMVIKRDLATPPIELTFWDVIQVHGNMLLIYL